MRPIPHSDGHDGPWLIGELVPSVTTMGDDVVIGSEDPVGEPVFPHVLPDVLNRIEFRRFGGQGHQRDVFRDIELAGEMPSGPIDQEDGMGAWCHGFGDLRQMQGHRVGVAPGQDQPGRGSLSWADGAEDVGGTRALILGCRGPCAAPRPAPGDLVLLTDPGLVLKPDFYRLACRVPPDDLLQAGSEVFLKAVMASASWA